MDLWIELHMLTSQLAEGFDWMDIQRKFFAAGPRRNRQFALTRGQLVVRNFISLRDWRAKGWQDLKLIGLLTKLLHDIALPTTVAKAGTSKVWSCSHCYSELHAGGATNCPLKEIKTKVARKLVTTALKDTDPKGALDRLIAAELANE
jgi:hypothetical protein